MLSRHDDFPIHQTPEPLAHTSTGDRNFYDRYWLGGFQDTNDPGYYEPDGAWKWVTGEPWSYANWKLGEPNDTGALLVQLNSIRSMSRTVALPACRPKGRPGYRRRAPLSRACC